MLVPFALFLVLVIWALIDGEMYGKEAAIWGVVWLACLLGFFLVRDRGFYFVVPMCLVDAVLLIKLLGNPSVT